MPSVRITITPGAEDSIAGAVRDYFESQLGPRIQANAQRTVPVESGDLKRSIILQVQEQAGDAVLQVGVDEDVAGVDYGLYVEDGTSLMRAQPYLRPAVYQARGGA